MWSADLGNGKYRNPILYADYSDPDVVRVGEDYYMIASSFSNSPAIPLLHSKDLVNWKVVNYVLKHVPEFRYRNPIHGCGVWAPSIRYHEGTYYVCLPMPDEGIYMTTAKDPLGEWSTPVNIRPKAGWIDPCPFWDDDGKAYLVAGVAKSRIGYKSVLHMVEMQPDGMGLIGEEVKIFDGNLNDQVTIEGPKLHKKDGWYYIFAPAGGVKTGWQTVLRSKNIFGPYEYKVVMRQGDSPVNGPHQGAWVDTVTGEDWFIHFQDVYACGRITHLQPMHWENGWPIIGVNKEGNDYGEPVMEYTKPNVGNVSQEVCEPDASDDFTGDKLGLQWQFNANYEDSWYDMTGAGIKLNAVNAVKTRPLGDIRNLLLQKWPAPEFTCVTTMDIGGLKDGDTAGVISLGMEYCAITLQKCDEGYAVKHVKGVQNFDCDMPYTDEDINQVCTFSADTKKVYFKYTVKVVEHRDHDELGLTVKNVPHEDITMEISTDGTQYNHALTIHAKAGRWVGVKNGAFIRHDSDVKEDGGYIIVEKVEYTN